MRNHVDALILMLDLHKFNHQFQFYFFYLSSDSSYYFAKLIESLIGTFMIPCFQMQWFWDRGVGLDYIIYEFSGFNRILGLTRELFYEKLFIVLIIKINNEITIFNLGNRKYLRVQFM